MLGSRATWPELGLEPKAAKTRIVHLVEGGEGFDFLGFHHRLVRARGRTGARRFVFLARWPSRRAAQHARDRLRELTARERLLVPVEEVVGSINRFLRGWAGFFRIGNSARLFDKIRHYDGVQIVLYAARFCHASTCVKTAPGKPLGVSRTPVS